MTDNDDDDDDEDHENDDGEILMGVSLLNFFDMKPLNTSKRALNTNHPFFGTPCIYKQGRESERNPLLIDGEQVYCIFERLGITKVHKFRQNILSPKPIYFCSLL